MNQGEGTRDLEQQLAEAKATINALLAGQIDAVLDPTDGAPVLLRNALEALQESLGEFRSLAEAMPQIVWITRPDGGNIYFNHQWMDYTGLTLEESVGDGWNKPFHPDDRQRAWDAWQRAATTIGTYSIECRLRRADGEYRWWLVRGVPLQDANGTILKWFGTCTDIHDLKLADLEISRINRALGMLSRCNDALIRTTHEPDLLNEICKIVVGVGGYRMAWIGYAQDDESRSITPIARAGVEDGYLTDITVTGNVNEPHGQGPAGEAIRTGQAVLCDDVASDPRFACWLPFAQQRGYRGNICLPLRDATHTFGVLALYAAEARGTSAEELALLQELADNLAFGIGKVRAESERARLGVQVREQAALLDIAQEAILVKDLDGRIVYWNKGAERTYGWSAADAVGRKAAELFHHDAGFQQAQATCSARGEWRGEQVKRTKAGHDLTVDERWTLVRDKQGQPTSILAIASDITDRKRVEAELRTAKVGAEAANLAKSEFLANMSHEIRTPMNGVIGMTDLMLDSKLTAEQRENLGIIKSSADALMKVINDILDFSRIEAGRLELDPIDFSPRDAIGDAARAVAQSAHEKGLELVVDVDTAVSYTLRGDPGRLRQVLLNLLGNAIKFTHNGEVVLRVTMDVATPQHVVLRFSVSDTGIGIPLARQQSIFQAFTQVDGSTTRNYGGTGLGLTISSELVQLMGGRISVESEAGQGSTFRFTARFAPAADPVALAVPALDDDLRDVTALIVDDNATNRRLLEGMLIGWRITPTLTASVPEALAALRAAQGSGRPFRLVLADAQMPDADGFTLAAAIKQDPTVAAPAVVMLTSGGQLGDAARCRELGIAAYLPKPIRRPDLRAAILLALRPQSNERSRQELVTRHSLREARHTGRILLVEDNRVSQLIARRLLEKAGHTVVVATNGREALAILEEAEWTGFGCALMDVQMPEMGGFECTAIIRARELGTRVHLPIIAMTAHAMSGDEARCVVAGMDAYLSKPIDPNALFDVVDRQLLVSSPNDELGPKTPRGSDAFQSAAVASAENERRP